MFQDILSVESKSEGRVDKEVNEYEILEVTKGTWDVLVLLCWR